MDSYEKIASFLRIDKDYPRIIDELLVKRTGVMGVFDALIEENKSLIADRISRLGIKNPNAGTIYDALLRKVEEDDGHLKEYFYGKAGDMGEKGFSRLIKKGHALSGVGRGFFLKKEVAENLLKKNPPPHILSILGYASVAEMLKHENLFEIFSALRFVEGNDWLNSVFFKPYELLTPDDFEEREITPVVIGDKFRNAAESFIKKKYHNVSHLKELGVVFVIPISMNYRGETLRTLSLVLHYFHEVAFYSKLFRKYLSINHGRDFSTNFASALRGDVLDVRPSEDLFGEMWLIVQRYLAKIDLNDWRLSYPHINPEAIHWTKAEEDIAKFAKEFDGGFDFWKGLDFAAEYYKDSVGADILVSFNLVDTVMSLVDEKKMVKYLYHQQEALWNRIFMGYFGTTHVEEMILENFDKGYIQIKA